MVKHDSSRSQQGSINMPNEPSGTVDSGGYRRYTRATLPLRSEERSIRVEITAADIRAYFHRCALAIERHRDYLTRLDTVLGDGDHGDNMAIGFQAVRELLEGFPAEATPGELLRAVGHRLATAVGGASGPLYGTALIEAGLVAGSQPALDWPLIGRLLEAATTGLVRRGRCVIGDKTILDTLGPAADAALAGDSLSGTLRAAWLGMRSTRPLVARRGLALRLGERSRGHLDPGAVSCFVLLSAMAR
jgi:dihydroxyacetone kinase-like protein